MRVFFKRNSFRDSARDTCRGCCRNCDGDGVGDVGCDKDFLLELRLSFLHRCFSAAYLWKIRAHLRAVSKTIDIRKGLDIPGLVQLQAQVSQPTKIRKVVNLAACMSAVYNSFVEQLEQHFKQQEQAHLSHIAMS